MFGCAFGMLFFQDVEGVAFGRLEAKFYCTHCTGLGGRPLAVSAFPSNKNQTVLKEQTILKEQTVTFNPRLQACKHSPVCTDGLHPADRSPSAPWTEGKLALPLYPLAHGGLPSSSNSAHEKYEHPF